MTPSDVSARKTWALSVVREGPGLPYLVYLRQGSMWFLLWDLDEGLPLRWDPYRDAQAAAEGLARVLSQYAEETVVVPGSVYEAYEPDGRKAFFVLLSPLDVESGQNMALLQTDRDDPEPVGLAFYDSKSAYAYLCEVVDQLIGGAVDWSKWQVPAE